MISRIILFLKKWPLHLLLLPLFFIISIYNQYAGMVSTDDATVITIYVFAAILILSWAFLLLYKSMAKAAIATTVIGFFYLFFGNIKALIGKTKILDFIAQYKVILPLLIIFFAFFLFKLFKRKTTSTPTLFLNILFGVYIAIELSRLSQLNTSSSLKEWNRNDNFLTTGSKQYPNIFYIVLDGYPGSRYQKELLQADKNELDSLLSKKSFFVVKNPTSNYNYTSFSIASTININYLGWLKNKERNDPKNYHMTLQVIENSVVLKKLMQEHYYFNNLSIFNLPGNPSIRRPDFLSLSSREMILYNTFYPCLKRDLLLNLFPSLKVSMEKKAMKQRMNWHKGVKAYNQYIIDSLLKLRSQQISKSPFFIYAHLIMPHAPYFFDSTGRAYSDEMIFADNWKANKIMFKNYIAYTNHQTAMLVDTIFKRANGNDIIIIQSDHGMINIEKSRREDAFRNYSAFYFPDRDYRLLYDSMSNVNTFRIIFNKYFGQQLPLLKDSSIYLR